MTTGTEIDTKPLVDEGQALVTRAAGLSIATHQEFEVAGAMLRDVVTLKKSIADKFAGPKKAAHEAHKRITALETEMLQAPAKAEQILKRTMGEYQMAEEKRRREEEARIQEQLRKQEEDRRLAEAAQIEKSGNRAVAEAILDAPMAAPVVALPKPMAAGVSSRKRWAFRIVNEQLVKRPYLLVDEKKIRTLVASLGRDAEDVVGGIQCYEESQISVRTGTGGAR
jgi:hypothetical protein